MLRNPIAIVLRKIFPKLLLRHIYYGVYVLCLAFLKPVNYVLAWLLKDVKYPDSVLHISYPVHIPYYTVNVLRRKKIRADYLAVNGIDPLWHKFDYYFTQPAMPWTEFTFFWRVVAKYEIIHTHFGIMLSASRWEVPILKRMGRKILVNYRGCEARNRELNMALHPEMNICQDCDHHGRVCRQGKKTVDLFKKYGDFFLVTTPDMRDFIPEAQHFRFFRPEIDYDEYTAGIPQSKRGGAFKIVHATNHPGIEGTRYIVEAVRSLKSRGYSIDFVFLRGVTHEKVLREIHDADVTIGKMKMGYYANQQIESLYLGVPAITYIRPEFMTSGLENSGLILTDIEHLENTIADLIDHPKKLEQKRSVAHSSILHLHDNDKLADELIGYYRQLLDRK